MVQAQHNGQIHRGRRTLQALVLPRILVREHSPDTNRFPQHPEAVILQYPMLRLALH